MVTICMSLFLQGKNIFKQKEKETITETHCDFISLVVTLITRRLLWYSEIFFLKVKIFECLVIYW